MFNIQTHTNIPQNTDIRNFNDISYPPCWEAGVVFVMTTDLPSLESRSTCLKSTKEIYLNLTNLMVNNVSVIKIKLYITKMSISLNNVFSGKDQV